VNVIFPFRAPSISALVTPAVLINTLFVLMLSTEIFPNELVTVCRPTSSVDVRGADNPTTRRDGVPERVMFAPALRSTRAP
jgi:hypothetical protein